MSLKNPTADDIAKNGYFNYKKADKERFINALHKAGKRVWSQAFEVFHGGLRFAARVENREN